MDPAEISTLPELAAALAQLRRKRSVQAQADAAKNPSPRGGRRPALPRSTASDLLKAKSVPTAETVVTFLADCGVRGEESQRPWLQALDRVATQHQQRPPAAVRVRDAWPRMLGVHAAIQTARPPEDAPSGSGEDELPLYVPRDFDANLRAKLARAGQQGGFVLLVGDSSVGKTRALFQAVQAVLPDRWLLHPGDAETLREFAAHPAGRTVVWLDELQDYLDFGGGVPAGQVRELMAAGVMLVATCWPGEHRKRVALPEEGQPDPYANDRRLLGLADVLHVPSAFSPRERRRAEDLASADHRIRVALDTPDAGFTQVMAAGPELIRHWTQAPAYAQAVITAALDARRVGAHAPLTRDYLADAAPGYLNGREVATAPPDWLENAIDYATTLLHGATASLTPVSAGMGIIAGYQVADYLHQHALHARRREPVPNTAWHALVRHQHPDDTLRIADNAQLRGHNHEALTLYQQLAERGDEYATDRWAELLAEQGQLEQLRTRADNGNVLAALHLNELLAEQGQLEQLRTRADNGDEGSALWLARLLAAQGQIEDAIQLLRSHTNNNRTGRDIQLAELLAARGQVDEAIQLLRPYANQYDADADIRLAELLAAQGQVEDAIQLVRPLAIKCYGVGKSRSAVTLFAELLSAQGQLELPAAQGQLEQVRTRADNGDEGSALWLAELLAVLGQVENAIEVLRPHVNGIGIAAVRLAELLATQGQAEEAIQLLRPHADNRIPQAAFRLTELLAAQGQIEELEREVAAGTIGAVAALRRVRSRISSHGD